METVVNLGAAVAAAAKAQQSYTSSPNEGTLVFEMLRLTYKPCLGIALVCFFCIFVNAKMFSPLISFIIPDIPKLNNRADIFVPLHFEYV